MYKKTNIIILSLLALVVFISLFSKRAIALDSRCSQEVWDIMKTQSKIDVLMASALANELLKQNDPVLALTCFDKALQQTAKAGSIFSDVPMSLTQGGNFSLSNLFTTFTSGLVNMVTTGINQGYRGITLAENLQNTIGETMRKLLDGYVNVAAGALVMTVQNSVSNLFGNVLGSIAGGLMGSFFANSSSSLGGLTFDCPNMIDVWRNDPAMAIVGVGIAVNNPFFTYDEIFNYATGGGGPTGLISGDAFDNKITGSFLLLQDGSDNLNNRLVPGGISSYTNVPTIGRDSSFLDVINAM